MNKITIIAVSISLLVIVLYINRYEYDHISKFYDKSGINENDLKKLINTGISYIYVIVSIIVCISHHYFLRINKNAISGW